MAPEYIAIIATILVLGGVIVIGLVIFCIINIVANKKLKKFPSTQLKGDLVELRNAYGLPSYVHYPEPEPYTSAPHDPEDNQWRPGYHNNQRHDEYNPTVVDVLGHSMFPGPPAPHDMPRRPSHAQALPYRPSSVQNMPRRPSMVQGLPRRSSYAQGMPRRPSYAQAMPRSRYSYAPEILRRPSNAQAVQRRPSAVSHAAGRPSRRQSYNVPAQELSSGQQNKLWYYYLKEDPDYFTQDALERNKKQPRVWSAERGRNTPSSAPLHAPLRGKGELPQQHHHHDAPSRFSWI